MLFFIALPMALPKTRNPSIPNLSLCSRSGTELKLSAHLYVRPESFRQKCAKGVESPILTRTFLTVFMPLRCLYNWICSFVCVKKCSGLYVVILTQMCGVPAVDYICYSSQSSVWRGEEMVRKALEHNASLPLAPFQATAVSCFSPKVLCCAHM